MADRPAKRRWGCLRRVALGLASVAVLGVAGAIGGYAWLRSAAGQEWLRAQAEAALTGAMSEGSAEIGALSTDLFGLATLTDVRLLDGAGRRVLDVGHAEVRVRPLAILSWRVLAPTVTASGVVVDLRRDEAGTYDIARMFAGDPAPPPAAPWSGLPIGLDFPEIALDAPEVSVDLGDDDLLLRDVEIRAGFFGEGRRLELRALSLSADLITPERGPVSLTADAIWDGLGLEDVRLDLTALGSAVAIEGRAPALLSDAGEVDLGVRLDPLRMASVDAFVRAGLGGVVGGELRARGPVGAIDVRGALRGVEGTDATLDLAVVVDGRAGSFDGSLDVGSLRLDHIVTTIAEPLAVGGRLTLSGAPDEGALGLRASGRLDGGRAAFSGVVLDELASGIALEDRGLVLTGLAARGPVGDVQGGGSLDLISGRLALDLVLSDVDPSTLRSFGVPAELDGTRAAGSVTVTVDTFDPEIPIGVAGTVTAAPLRWGPDIRVARVASRIVVDVQGGATTVRGDATFAGIEAYGATVASGAARALRVRADASNYAVNAELRLEDVRYDAIPAALEADLGRGARFDVLDGPLVVRGSVADPEDLRVDLRMVAGPHRLLRFDGDTGEVAVVLDGSALSLVAALDAGPERRLLDAHVDMALDEQTIAIERLVFAPLPAQRWAAEPGGRLRLTEDGGVTDLAVALALFDDRPPSGAAPRGERGRIEARGAFGGAGEQDLRVSVYDLDLAAIAELLPTQAGGLQGAVGADLVLRGVASALTIRGPVELVDVAWWETDDDGAALPVLRDIAASLQIDGAGDRIEVRGGVRGLDAPLLTLDVTLPFTLDLERLGPVPDGPFSADIQLVAGRLKRLETVLPGVVLPVGVGSGRLRGSGTLVRPELRWAGVVELPVEGMEREARLETFVTLAGSDLRASVDAREGLHLRAEARVGGRTRIAEVLDWALIGAPEPDLTELDLWLSALYGGVGLRGLPLRRIAETAGVTVDVDGALWGDVLLAGSLRAPRPAGRLYLEDGRVGGVEISTADLLLESDDDGFTLGLDIALRDVKRDLEGEIYVDGRVPVAVDLGQPDPASWVRGPLDLRATAEIPMAILSGFDPGFRDLAGSLLVNGFVAGDPLDPEPRAGITLTRGAAIGYAPLGVRFTELALDADFNRDGLTLRRLSTVTAALDPRRSQLGLLSVVGKEVGRGFGLFGRRKRAERRSAAADAIAASRPDAPLRRGEIRASGTASLKRWILEGLDITATLERALVLGNPDQTLRLSTMSERSLRVTGDAMFPVVAGGVRVDEADFYLDYATAVGGAPLEVDPRITVHRASGAIVTPPAEASVLDDVAVEVRIDLGRASRGRLSMPIESMAFLGQATTALTRLDLSARLGGDVVFRQLPCRRRGDDGVAVAIPGRAGGCGLFHPQIEGSINVLEGAARVFRADFTLQDSRVDFFGAEVYDPNLEIRGVMKTGDVSIEMAVGGTALSPDVQFTSADTDQVFATLLLGTSPDALGSQGASQLAFAAAMTAFQSVLSGANLGTFSIQPSGQVAWGLAVARDLYVEGTIGGTPRPDQNTFEVEAEYTITQGLIGRVGFGAYAIPFWLDLLLERRFD